MWASYFFFGFGFLVYKMQREMPLRQNLPHRIILRSKRINTETEAGTYSVPFSSVTQSCPTLWDPMNRSTPGLPVHHQLLEFTQTHIHRVGDAIQPSYPLSSPSPPAPNPSQHQSLFQWVNSSHYTVLHKLFLQRAILSYHYFGKSY